MVYVGGSVTGAAQCGGAGASATWPGRGMGETTNGSEGSRSLEDLLVLGVGPRCLRLVPAEEDSNGLQVPAGVEEHG